MNQHIKQDDRWREMNREMFYERAGEPGMKQGRAVHSPVSLSAVAAKC